MLTLRAVASAMHIPVASAMHIPVASAFLHNPVASAFFHNPVASAFLHNPVAAAMHIPVASAFLHNPVASAFRRKNLLAILLLTISSCAGIETETGVYATVAEARAAGAIERGWVPEGLPATATDLREGHRGDDQQWGLFVFPPADAEAVRGLVGAEITSAPPECDPPGRLEWWPRILRSPLDLTQVQSTGLRLYRARTGRLTYAVNWQQGRAFYWK